MKTLRVAYGLLLLLPLLAWGADRPNVLFIAVDDLRPELGCYGADYIRSPHMDRLASEGVVFQRAYCQQAICMSSRASLMGGVRPDRGGIYQNRALFEHLPGVLTLNQHFLDSGYETAAVGKIYHHSSDYKTGWSTPWYKPKGEWEGRGYLGEESIRLVREYNRTHQGAKRQGMGPAFEGPDVGEEEYPDGMIAQRAVRELRRLQDKPFFLAVGFMKPHLPFNAPKKYWDLYDRDSLPMPKTRELPRGAPGIARSGWGELRGYHGMPDKGPTDAETTRDLIHGYAACVSYADAMIGQVLEELDRLDLADRTIVVLWGDHGWKLGDYGMWCKHTNFEQDTRVPLVIRAPGKAAGTHTKALVELVDLYPTLCELTGLPLPDHLDGTSFAPVLGDSGRTLRETALSQYPRGKSMGYSLRTDRYRYTEWRNRQSGKVGARELYDFQADPEGRVNHAENPDFAEVVAAHAALLEKRLASVTP